MGVFLYHPSNIRVKSWVLLCVTFLRKKNRHITFLTSCVFFGTQCSILALNFWKALFFFLKIQLLDQKTLQFRTVTAISTAFATAISHCNHKSLHKPIVCSNVLGIKEDTNRGECYFFCNIYWRYIYSTIQYILNHDKGISRAFPTAFFSGS